MYKGAQRPQPEPGVEPPPRSGANDANVSRDKPSARSDRKAESPAETRSGDGLITLGSYGQPPSNPDATRFFSLLDIDDESLLTITFEPSVEINPSLSHDYVPMPSLGLDAKSLHTGSVDVAFPTAFAGVSAVVGHGMDGSWTAGVGYGAPALGTKFSGVGVQAYAYTVCPDSGRCFDGGVKAQLGALTVKVEAGLSTGPALNTLSLQLRTAIENAVGTSPVSPAIGNGYGR